MQPIAVDDGMTARLGDLDVLHADDPQIGGHEFGRGAAVRGVSRYPGDAGDAEQIFERLEPRFLRAVKEPLQVRIRCLVVDCVGHLPLQLRLSPPIV